MVPSPHALAVEAASRPRKCGHETPQLRLERRLHDGSPYRSSDLVSAGPAEGASPRPSGARSQARTTQRRHSDSAGCEPESLSGKELRPASLEANVSRRWGRLLSGWRGLPQDPHHHRDGPRAASCSTPSARTSAKRARRQTRRAESLSGSIRQFLTPEVWKQARQAARAAGCRNDPRWPLQPLILIWALMTWCAGQTDAERFLTARTFYLCPRP